MHFYSEKQSGFTILELLVVIGIITLIASVFAYTVIGWVQKSRLREASYQVISDLRRARSQAQLTSQDSAVWLCSPAVTPDNCNTSFTAPSAVYTTSWGASAELRAGSQKTLPYGITISPAIPTTTSANYPNSVKYTAPYASTDGEGAVWSLRSPNGLKAFIKIIGVTGKVAISDSVD